MRQLSKHEVQSVSGGASPSPTPVLSLLALPFVALFATAFLKANGSTLTYFEVLQQGFDSLFPKT